MLRWPLKKKLTLRQNEGVTFIELVVVIAIFSIIAGTLVFNFARFGRNITIQNMAQDIALQINSAQREAISGQTNVLLANCDRTMFDCSPRYGVYMVARGGDAATMSSFGGTVGTSLLRFFDNQDYLNPLQIQGILDIGGLCGTSGSGGGTGECTDNLSIGQGNYISEICVGSNDFCDTVTTKGLNIVFKRPFPDASIKLDDNTSWNYARITVTSPNTDTLSKDIIVTSLGQITVETTP